MFSAANTAEFSGGGALAALQSSYADDCSDDDGGESMECDTEKRVISHYQHDDDDITVAKRPRTDACLVPPPSALSAMFCQTIGGSTEPCGDDDHHQGRVRGVPHVRGNWAALLYVACSDGDVLEANFTSLVAACTAVCESVLPGSMTCVPRGEWHVSVSRTLYLRHHWIDQLIDRLRRVVLSHRCFSLSVADAAVYVNDEKTRTFVGLSVCAGRARLYQLCSDINACLHEYGLPPYYQDANFHMSITWCVGDVSASLTSRLLPRLSVVIEQYRRHADLSFDVSTISFKCGNKLYQLPLSS